jgi:hypothetical protein
MFTHSTTCALCVIEAVTGLFLFDRQLLLLRDGSRSRISKLRWVLDPERIGRRRCRPLLAAVAVLTELAGHCYGEVEACISALAFGCLYAPSLI